MRRARADTTIERNVYPENKIEIKLDGNLITNEIYHMAEVIWLFKDEQGNTFATNYQPSCPTGIVVNYKWNEESYIFKPYKVRDSYWRPCAELVEKKLRAQQKELQKNLKLFCKTFKKYFLTFFNYRNKISYNIKVNLKQGEFKKMDKSLFIKPTKTKLESITESAEKNMGMTVSINDPKKKEFFWINKIDETTYVYFAIGIAAREIEVESKKSGKKLTKLVFDFDHLKKPVYIAKWTALMASGTVDDLQQPFWIVAIKKDDFNKAMIADLDSLTQSEPNIVIKVDKTNKDNFKVIY